MNEQNTKPEETQMAGCCGTKMTDMTQGCHCGSAFKKHRLACFVMITVMVLAFLISQVGGILGIIGFTRTF